MDNTNQIRTVVALDFGVAAVLKGSSLLLFFPPS